MSATVAISTLASFDEAVIGLRGGFGACVSRIIRRIGRHGGTTSRESRRESRRLTRTIRRHEGEGHVETDTSQIVSSVNTLGGSTLGETRKFEGPGIRGECLSAFARDLERHFGNRHVGGSGGTGGTSGWRVGVFGGVSGGTYVVQLAVMLWCAIH